MGVCVPKITAQVKWNCAYLNLCYYPPIWKSQVPHQAESDFLCKTTLEIHMGLLFYFTTVFPEFLQKFAESSVNLQLNRDLL